MRRKDFIKLSTLFGGGLFSGASYAGNRKKRISDLHPSEAFANAGIQGSMFDYADAPIEKVRVAIVGLGNRGSTLVEMLSWLVRHNHAEIVAICDSKFLIVGIGINIRKSPKIKNYPTTNLYDLTNKHFNKREIENKLKLIFETNFSKMYKVNKN